MSSGWFPRLSPDGKHVASGSGLLEIDGREVGPGWSAAWKDNDTVVYNSGASTLQVRLSGPDFPHSEQLSLMPFNRIVAGGGRWAGERKEGVWRDGFFWRGDAFAIDMNAEGRLVFLTNHDSLYHDVWTDDGKLHSSGTIASEPRISRQAIVWVDRPGPNQRIMGKFINFPQVSDWSVSYATEYDPVLIDTPNGPWLLTHDLDNRVLLRPCGSTTGLLVPARDTYNPHAMRLADGSIKIVWSNAFGVLDSIRAVLGSPDMWTDLSVKPAPSTPPPPPPPQEEDIVDPKITVLRFSDNGITFLDRANNLTFDVQLRPTDTAYKRQLVISALNKNGEETDRTGSPRFIQLTAVKTV